MECKSSHVPAEPYIFIFIKLPVLIHPEIRKLQCKPDYFYSVSVAVREPEYLNLRERVRISHILKVHGRVPEAQASSSPVATHPFGVAAPCMAEKLGYLDTRAY